VRVRVWVWDINKRHLLFDCFNRANEFPPLLSPNPIYTLPVITYTTVPQTCNNDDYAFRK